MGLMTDIDYIRAMNLLGDTLTKYGISQKDLQELKNKIHRLVLDKVSE